MNIKDYKKIYDVSPSYLQNIELSAMSLNTVFRRNFNPFFKEYYATLLKTQWCSKKELDSLQNKKLKTIVEFAYKNVPYYHKIFRSKNIYPKDIRTTEDLKRLPILTKEIVRNNWHDFVPTNIKDIPHIQVTTTGSTGRPLDILWSKKSRMIEDCFGYRMREWAGLNVTSKLAHFGSNRLFFNNNIIKPPFWRENFSERIVYFSQDQLSEKNLPYYIKKLQSFQPEILRGHASKLFLIAYYIKKMHDGQIIHPKAIFPSSEMLLPNHAKLMTEVFDCPIYDYYGNNERVSSISQCEKGAYHINSEYGIIEFMKNGEEVSSGEMGEMICTGFINEAFPLIRYNMEDLAVPSTETCSCGRHLPIVKSILGRTRDIIVTSDGKIFTTGSIIDGIQYIKSIKEWQFIQKSKEEYIMNIVIDRTTFSELDISHIETILRNRVGEGSITINVVDTIIRPENKFRAVISEVPFDWN